MKAEHLALIKKIIEHYDGSLFHEGIYLQPEDVEALEELTKDQQPYYKGVPCYPYDREILTEVLVYHQRKSDLGCACGWDILGASHAEHIADVYEESIRIRTEE